MHEMILLVKVRKNLWPGALAHLPFMLPFQSLPDYRIPCYLCLIYLLTNLLLYSQRFMLGANKGDVCLKTVEKVFGVSSTWCFILEKYAIGLDPAENSLGGLPMALPWGGPLFLAVAVECLSFLPRWGGGLCLLCGKVDRREMAGSEAELRNKGEKSRVRMLPAMTLEIYRSKLSTAVPA